MLYVYYGYCSPDNYDSSEGPTYLIKEFSSSEDVAKFRKECDIHFLSDECSNVIFRVFEGKELFLQPKKIVESYELG